MENEDKSQTHSRNATQLMREEELYKEEEDVKALLDAPTDSAILIERNGKVLAINKIGAMRFGKRKDELIGKDIFQYLPAEVLKRRKPFFDMVARTRREVHFEDERNGRILSNHIYPLFDSELRVDRFAIFTRDITEKRRALLALEETERVLKERTRNLEEANIALGVLLRKRERDREDLEQKVWFNFKQLVMPFLGKLKESGLNQSQKTLADLVESSLNDIISSFSKKLVVEYSGFTPTEIQVANLIKQGKTKKEIAEMFNCSIRTIETHVHNIRRKLDIKNKKINLKVHLLSLE